MFKAIGWLIKLSLFTTLVLVLGNYFKWGGKTVSDQVKTQMSKAESLELPSIPPSVRGWTRSLVGDAKRGAKSSKPRPIENELRPEDGTEIPSSERQKLKTLIRDLNTSYGRD